MDDLEYSKRSRVSVLARQARCKAIFNYITFSTIPLASVLMFMAYPFFNLIWVIPSILLTLFGLGWVVINLTIRHSIHYQNCVDDLNNERDEYNNQQLENIAEFFGERNHDIAEKQVYKIQNKLIGFYNVLQAKFDSSEITYNRYATVANAVVDNALKNLNGAKTRLMAIDNIDPLYIEEQIIDLCGSVDSENDLNNEQREQLHHLQTRHEMYRTGITDVEKTVMLTEKAMTELDQMTESISKAIVGNDPKDELNAALDRINELTRQANEMFENEGTP